MLISGKSYTDSLPGTSADGGSKDGRLDRYGATHVRNELLAWAEEGTYFRATNATLGTGIAMGIQTAWSATANALLVMRSSSASKSIIPHYIRLINTVAGASTTSSRLAIALDVANRYNSGGTDLTGQIVNANSGLGPTSIVDVLRFGAVTAAAASAARYVSNMSLKAQAAPCWTVGDEVRIQFAPFGDADPGALSGAAALSIVKNVGPVVLRGQNHCLLLHMWNPANATTAPSWEIEMAWWER